MAELYIFMFILSSPKWKVSPWSTNILQWKKLQQIMSKNELYIFLAIQVIVTSGIYLSWNLKFLLLICIIHLNFVFYTLKLNSHVYFDGLKFILLIKWCSKIKMMSFCWCIKIFSSNCLTYTYKIMFKYFQYNMHTKGYTQAVKMRG